LAANAPAFRIAAGKALVRMVHEGPNYMGILEAYPGVAVRRHSHRSSYEMLYILEGAGKLTVAGKTRRIRRGQMIHLARGARHSLSIPKDSAGRLVAVQVYAGAGPEQRFKKGKPVASGPINPPLPLIGLFGPANAEPSTRSPYLASSAETYQIAGGKGLVRMVHQGPNYMGLLEASPGLAVPEHAHERSTEMLYVLEGAGTMILGGKQVPVKSGHFIQVPPGMKHAFSISKDSKRRFVAVQIYSPAGPEQRFKKGIRIGTGSKKTR
jgi:quercetin dioxygenase-like cupin family protein